MTENITIINADLQVNGTIVPNPSTTAGTVYVLVAVDDSVATATYNKAMALKGADKAKADAAWDATILARANQLISSSMMPKALRQAVVANAQAAANLSMIDEVP